ncbi:MAG: hypothetical protein J6R24_03615 [Clostridia bacterium]|nr:hypothetical protein [Clostridia bacterium]
MSLMAALLLGGQYVLAWVSGVEAVTVLLLSFSYVCGAKRGCTVATAFSLLRCFLFGFFPPVVLLYILYFNAFALFWGTLGKKLKRLPAVVFAAAVCTVGFTLLDDLLWPMFAGWNIAWAYFLASLSAMLPHTLCTVATVTLFFRPLTKIFNSVAKNIVK